MKILVVGAAGFVGSHLTERFVAEGFGVDAIDDLSTGSLANLADARALGGDLKIHTIDASSDDFVTLAVSRQPQVIYHLGCMPPGRDSPRSASSAVHSMLNVLEAARQLGDIKVVAALPAVSLYGEVGLRDLPVKEGHPLDPFGLSGVVASTITDLMSMYRRHHDVEFTALLLANVYGSRQRNDAGVVSSFAQAIRDGQQATIFGDGRQTRDFLYIDDTIDALARAATKGDGLTINVGSGIATTIRELWAMMAGPSAPAPNMATVRPIDVSRSSLAITRARIHLGWAPWTDLATGLRAVR